MRSFIFGASMLLLAHGEAQWISDNPNYVFDSTYKDNVHCCGPQDCSRIPLTELPKYVNGGWLIPSTGQIFAENRKGLYPSIDENWWWCRPNGHDVVCLFKPVAGS
jgi:hypothetical protein